MTKIIRPVQDFAGEQHPCRRYNLNREGRRLTNTLFMGPSSLYFLTAVVVQAAQKTLQKCNSLSWLTVPNNLKFKQNTFFSKR